MLKCRKKYVSNKDIDCATKQVLSNNCAHDKETKQIGTRNPTSTDTSIGCPKLIPNFRFGYPKPTYNGHSLKGQMSAPQNVQSIPALDVLKRTSI